MHRAHPSSPHDKHSPSRRGWLDAGRWLAATLLVGFAAGLLVLAPSCTLPRLGLATFEEEDAGMAGECEEPADCPGLFLDCRAPSCSGGICGTANEAGGTSCDDDGGIVCNGQGLCVECIETTHCQSGEICQSNLCVPASCGDGKLNAGETDVDCGGPCAPCDNGKGCDDGSDCVSGNCAAGTCAPCTVTADCGGTEWCDAGTCVPGKQDGDTCDDDEQCASGSCPEDDGACCNQECAGLCMACIPGQTGLALGECGPVLNGDDFKGECPDAGSSTCGSNGQGCNGAGACILYDPGTQCVAASCTDGERQRPDTCDGSGTCDDGGIQTCSPYQCNGTACRTSCSDDAHCLDGSYCDGTGHCVSKGDPGNPCGAHNECGSGFCVDGRCCESACTGTCMACSNIKTGFTNGQCRSIPTDPIPNDPDDECDRGACYRVNDTTGQCRYNRGHSCDGSTVQCLQDPCVDGYCCESACTGLCESCNGSQTIGANGTCAAIIADDDPEDECSDEGASSCGSNGDGCDGSRACILYPNGTVCQPAFCSGTHVLTLADRCNGNGSCQDGGTQDCSPYPCQDGACLSACSGHTDCADGYFCNGSSQCQQQGTVGTACGADVECDNDRCVEGYCCNAPCGGDCESCDGAFNADGNGHCSNVRVDEDPKDRCDYACDGTGSCQADDGTDCSVSGVICGGFCVDGYCCNSQCDGVCEACRGDHSGGPNGTCTPIPNGQDPAGECPGSHVCLGDGTCS